MVKTKTKNAKKRQAPSHAEISRRGGAARTTAQNDARRRNAQLAGRPKRVCIHCGEGVRGGHVDQSLDTTCGAHGWRWRKPHELASPSSPSADQVLDALAFTIRASKATSPDSAILQTIIEAVRATGRAV